ARGGRRGVLHERLGQPWADVLLAARARRLEAIEAQARDDLREERAWVEDVAAIRALPPQESGLDDMLPPGHRADDPARDARDDATVGLEARGHVVIAHAAPRSTVIGAPAITTRWHALPWPSAYLSVG